MKKTKVIFTVLQFASFPENNKGGIPFPWIYDHGWGEKKYFYKHLKYLKEPKSI